MRQITYVNSDCYPVALLIKYSAFNSGEIQNTYVTELRARGIPLDDITAVALEYNEHGKAPVAFIKETLNTLLGSLDSLGVKYLYCADSAYFKILTGMRKAEPHLGYTLPCKIAGYEHMEVVLGVNHKSLLYNPANEPKLTLSIQTLATVVAGDHQELGQDIIHQASYPSTVESIKLELQELHQYAELSCDIETASLDFDKAGIGTVTFCWSQHEGIAFACDYRPFTDGPRDGFYGVMERNDEVRDLLRQFFDSYQGTLRWHNATYDLKVLVYELWMENLLDTPRLLDGLEHMTRRFHDTKIIAYLATNTTAGNALSLKDLAHEFAGKWAQEDIKDIRRIPLHELLKYNLIDGLATNYVFDKYYPRMVADQQEDLYYGLMLPSQRVITQMELTGMPLDPNQVQDVRRELEGIVAAHEAVFSNSPIVDRFNSRLQREAMEAANAKLKVKQHPIEAFAHVTFNANSGAQKQKLLYEEIGLPVVDLTDGKQPATGGDTLEKLLNHTDDPEHRAIIEALIGCAQASKILSSFVPAFEKAISKGDGVVWLHGSFNLGGTKSGRLSSSDPNLQNIPAKSTYGKVIKKCFRAPQGWLFCGADFNSLEDYISALTTKDPNKLKVYIEGYDGHSLRAFSYFPHRLPGIIDTVESINSIKKDPLLEAVRQDSKAPTFALTYQGTWRTLVTSLGFTPEVAKQIEANYHELYKVSDEWVQMQLEEARQKGYVTVAFGLRLRTPLLAQTLGGHRTTPYAAEAEGRTAGNALGQSYGLLTNRSMNAFMAKVWDSPYRYDIKPVAMIHDANYFLIKDNVDVVTWANRELIHAMQWQDLPEIRHDTVKLGAEMSIFWPTWADELTIPNEAPEKEIRALCTAFRDDYLQLKEVA